MIDTILIWLMAGVVILSAFAAFLAILEAIGREFEHFKVFRALRNLPESEQKILRDCLYRDTQTHHGNIYDGVVYDLIEKGIMHTPNTSITKAGERDFNMVPFVWNYLSRHPYLVDTTPELIETHRYSGMKDK